LDIPLLTGALSRVNPVPMGAQENRIREINPESKDEISLVAQRMRQTLVEVLGDEKAASLYSMF
jgi:hypothetical protein